MKYYINSVHQDDDICSKQKGYDVLGLFKPIRGKIGVKLLEYYNIEQNITTRSIYGAEIIEAKSDDEARVKFIQGYFDYLKKRNKEEENK